mmetsp:Transcript_15562/g.24412  ORF Transcript_15562/g.24412 Transcript_15562/m.24412 type:complete len:102 (+) Transcript_15562:77-382(+)
MLYLTNRFPNPASCHDSRWFSMYVYRMNQLTIGGNVHGIIFRGSSPIPSFRSEFDRVSSCILVNLLHTGPNRFLHRFGVLVSRGDSNDDYFVVESSSFVVG